MIPLYYVTERYAAEGMQILYDIRARIIKKVYGGPDPEGRTPGFIELKKYYDIEKDMLPVGVRPKRLIDSFIRFGFPPMKHAGSFGRQLTENGRRVVIRGTSREGKISIHGYSVMAALWMLSLMPHNRSEGPFPYKRFPYPVPIRPSMLMRTKSAGSKKITRVDSARGKAAGAARRLFFRGYRLIYGKNPTMGILSRVQTIWTVRALAGILSELSLLNSEAKGSGAPNENPIRNVKYYLATVSPISSPVSLFGGVVDLYRKPEDIYTYLPKLCDIIGGFSIRAARPLRKKKGAVSFHIPHLPETAVIYTASKTLRYDTPEGKRTSEAVTELLRTIVKEKGYGKEEYNLSIKFLRALRSWMIEWASGMTRVTYTGSSYPGRFNLSEAEMSIVNAVYG